MRAESLIRQFQAFLQAWTMSSMLDRYVHQLGFKGMLINAETNGICLEDRPL